MELNEQQLEELLEKAVDKAFKKDRDEFWISQPQHFLDHQVFGKCREKHEEWQRNHEFVSSIRGSLGEGRKISWRITVGALFIFAAAAIGSAIVNLVIKTIRDLNIFGVN